MITSLEVVFAAIKLLACRSGLRNRLRVVVDIRSVRSAFLMSESGSSKPARRPDKIIEDAGLGFFGKTRIQDKIAAFCSASTLICAGFALNRHGLDGRTERDLQKSCRRLARVFSGGISLLTAFSTDQTILMTPSFFGSACGASEVCVAASGLEFPRCRRCCSVRKPSPPKV